ncbi:amine sulfotransferase-like [Varanus komodoensis]|uniref:Sulfotransferase n=1 Tax=Varanus komodoensis TaxID=61221 RepID=A0A8D2J6E0_VARKO|nr:amine sulfotransferase-like [Varanus komodoensis]XP_044281942.1 amine sulfotransferase-like [Varanus komodoensis]
MAAMETPSFLFNFKGCYFASDFITPEYLETIEDFEVRDSDIFVVTYPKSGTVWAQNILCLILNESHRNGTGGKSTYDQAPFLDYNLRNLDLSQLPSPRVLMAHLPYHLIPKGLKEGKGKIIYVYRNPKDAMVSLYHYSSFAQTSADLEEYMQRYLAGKVVCSSIFDHVKVWYSHKNELDILFLSYEEMIKDLRGAVLKVCGFIGKQLSSQEVDKVVEMATFENMKRDPRANNVVTAKERFRRKDMPHLRKGTIGDWKNIMTVSQSERFDKVFQEKMKDIPLKFIWDIKETKKP